MAKTDDPIRAHILCPICRKNTKGRLPKHLRDNHKNMSAQERLLLNKEARLVHNQKKEIKFSDMVDILCDGKENNDIGFTDVIRLVNHLGINVLGAPREAGELDRQGPCELEPRDDRNLAPQEPPRLSPGEAHGLSPQEAGRISPREARGISPRESVGLSSQEVGGRFPNEAQNMTPQNALDNARKRRRILGDLEEASSDDEIADSTKIRARISEIYSSDDDSSLEKDIQSTKKVDWKTGVKAELLKAGLYESVDKRHPLLQGFDSYMFNVENNKSEKSRKNLISHLGKVLYFLANKTEHKSVSIELLKNKEGLQEFVLKNKECGMLAEGIKNLWDAIRRFLIYLRMGTSLHDDDKDMYMYLTHLEGCVNTWKKGNHKNISKELAEKRFKNVVDGDGAQQIQYTLDFFLDPKIREPIEKDLMELDKKFSAQLFVRVTRYLIAYSALTNGQRSGIPQNLTISEYEKGKMDKNGVVYMVWVLNHKTCTTTLGNLAVDLEMKEFFDKYLKIRQEMPMAKMCRNFFINTKGNPITASNEIERFESGLNLPRTTATQSRKAIQTAMVDKGNEERAMISGLMAHSETTAAKHYRAPTVDHLAARVSLMRNLQKNHDNDTINFRGNPSVSAEFPPTSPTSTTSSSEDDTSKYIELKEKIGHLVPPTPTATFPKNKEFLKIVEKSMNWRIPDKRVKNIRDLWHQRQDGARALDTAHKLRYRQNPDWQLVENNLKANGWHKKDLISKVISFWDQGKIPHRSTKEQLETELDDKIRRKVTDSVRVRVTKKKGKGLYATRDIQKGEYLCSYGGNLVDKKDVAQKYLETEGKCYFFDVVHEGKAMTFDATEEEGCQLGRYINHSRKDFSAIVKKRVVDGELQLIFLAYKEIKEGKEITFDYNGRTGKEDEVPYWMVIDDYSEDEFIEMSTDEVATNSSSTD